MYRVRTRGRHPAHIGPMSVLTEARDVCRRRSGKANYSTIEYLKKNMSKKENKTS